MAPLSDAQLRSIPADGLRGVGPRYASCLERLQIRSLFDLVLHLPFRYLDKTRITPIAALRSEGQVLLEVRVRDSSLTGRSARVLRVTLADDSGCIAAVFFNTHAGFARRFAPGRRLLAFGTLRFDAYSRSLVLQHPEVEFLDGATPAVPQTSLTPVYHLTSGLPQASLRRIIREGLDVIAVQPPEELLRPECNPFAMTLGEALERCHYPSPQGMLLPPAALPAFRRICFEELTAYQLAMLTFRRRLSALPAAVIACNEDVQARLLAALDFTPTRAQLRAFAEICADLRTGTPMMRLVHGDVGSGKTLVAAMALMQCAASGLQGALMAPTELLAEQHFRTLSQLLGGLGVRCILLNSSLTRAQRRQALTLIGQGEAQIVIGTHALFQADVTYAQLALAVIDEHHRFGVAQRAALLAKARPGQALHQLAMTATPIPRTMQMALYADLDISVLDELPPGRHAVQTALIRHARRGEVIARVRHVCATGVQVYWVCPAITEQEEGEAAAAESACRELAQALPELRVGLVHGQLSAARKQQVMHAFMEQELDVLVATTVIEVGVDVPNASVIIIEDADRLGLAQLHQLRGRVGRGQTQSYCLLLYREHDGHDCAMERLQVMRSTTDGFAIAAQDLQLRGPGEVLGGLQAGLRIFRVADVSRDAQLLADARQAALTLLHTDPAVCDRLIGRWFGCGLSPQDGDAQGTPAA